MHKEISGKNFCLGLTVLLLEKSKIFFFIVALILELYNSYVNFNMILCKL